MFHVFNRSCCGSKLIVKQSNLTYSFLQALSWTTIVISPPSISIITASTYLFLTNLGAAIAEVANDAIVAELSKQQPLPSTTNNNHSSSSRRGTLQSFCWICTAVGAVLGNLLGGIFISSFSPLHVFFIFSIFVASNSS
ncbi:hypothetical protein RIF29_38942 [Crotalaria pallida]|uniref:Uncharacterized protein n=1 Tax=Crotalaria pallida TaxID=3830 RepID=A0AAN9HP76_CROPI